MAWCKGKGVTSAQWGEREGNRLSISNRDKYSWEFLVWGKEWGKIVFILFFENSYLGVPCNSTSTPLNCSVSKIH